MWYGDGILEVKMKANLIYPRLILLKINNFYKANVIAVLLHIAAARPFCYCP